MKTFKLNDEEVSIEYCILKCDVCKSIFRHDMKLGSFGKPMKNRMCYVCGAKVPIDDAHCLAEDPLTGKYSAEFKTANNL